MITLRDIRSLTDFRRNTRAYLRRLKQNRSPTVLTVNGKAELIIQDAEAFEEMLDSIRGIQRGLDAMGDPTGKVLKRIRSKRLTSPSRKI